MKQLSFLLFVCTSSLFSQKTVEATLVSDTEITLSSIVDIDNFGIIYVIDTTVFHKIDTNNDINYSNVQLGKITSADAFNSLKINLFYKNFNTAIILDNRLAEIYKIDFNTIQPYKNVSHISTGYDNTLWIFNTDLQQLELFDYKNNNIRATAVPIQSQVLDMVSNYNFCWVLTDDSLYKYNYFGSLTSKIPNNGFTAIEEENGNIIAQKEDNLYFLQKEGTEFLSIPLNELLIKQFLVTNETLYIYDSKKLHQYQLKIK